MKYFTTEEWYLDYTKTIVENHNGNILHSLPQTLYNRIKDLPDSAKVGVIEREYNVLRLHRILRKLGWLRDWVITIPATIKLQGPSADYPGLGRILLDVVNYLDTRTTKLRKLGMESGTYIDRPLTYKVRLTSFIHYRYEIEEVLVKLGYVEKYKYTYYWRMNAQRLKTDDSSFFHIINAAGGMRHLSKESVVLIKGIFHIPDVITPVQLPVTIEPEDIGALAETSLENTGEVLASTPIMSNSPENTLVPSTLIKNNWSEVQTSQLKIMGKIDLPLKPTPKVEVKPYRQESVTNVYAGWGNSMVRDFRITEVSPRKRGAPGQFYKGIDKDGKLFNLLGFDDLTMLNEGESVTVDTIEKISRDGKHIYYVIRSLDESDGQAY